MGPGPAGGQCNRRILHQLRLDTDTARPVDRISGRLGMEPPAEMGPMVLDLNDPELEFSDLVYAYQSWVMAIINDEKLAADQDDASAKLLNDDIVDEALSAMRFLPGEVTSAIESSLARAYDVDPEELATLLFPED